MVRKRGVVVVVVVVVGIVLLCRCVDGGTELAKSLKLVYEFVKNVKRPIGCEVELGTAGGNVLFVEQFLQEFAVDAPSLHAILSRRTRHGVEMSVREFAVNGEKERISIAFFDNGLRRRPLRSSKVLNRNVVVIVVVIVIVLTCR